VKSSTESVSVAEKSPVYFVSLGCPKNLVDSQVMLGMLEKDRYSITQTAEDAEVIIVNTCSFIQASKEESIETILDMAELKQSAKCKVLVASGCLPQRYSAQLEQEMPEVDLFIGTGQYHRITELLDTQAKAREVGAPLPKRSYIDQPAFIHTENDPRMHTGPSYTGFLKLSEGCNRRCAFCIIPVLRGDVRSRTVESLVIEAKAMAERGVRELNLVAQDLTHYGIDTRKLDTATGKPVQVDSLRTLLPELCKIDGIDWIRLHYVYPDELSDEVIDIIAREPKIVKYLDMPIQHTNDAVLKSMNRRLTKSKLFDVVAKLRARVPDLVFRTSMIVGFPGETEEQFEEMCTDLETLKLDFVGVFRFSREEGTAAAEHEGQIHPGTKRRRAKKLIGILQLQAQARAEKFIGSVVPVMIEGPSEETELLIQGRMPTQAQEIDGHVLINDLADLGDDSDLRPGDLIEVKVTEANTHDLIGKAVRILSRARKSAAIPAASEADASAEWRAEKGLTLALTEEGASSDAQSS
jgi:ribosomal protein S12 methylthiotransferase